MQNPKIEFQQADGGVISGRGSSDEQTPATAKHCGPQGMMGRWAQAELRAGEDDDVRVKQKHTFRKSKRNLNVLV